MEPPVKPPEEREGVKLAQKIGPRASALLVRAHALQVLDTNEPKHAEFLADLRKHFEELLLGADLLARVMGILDECARDAASSRHYAEKLGGAMGADPHLVECWKSREAEIRNVRSKLLASIHVSVRSPDPDAAPALRVVRDDEVRNPT